MFCSAWPLFCVTNRGIWQGGKHSVEHSAPDSVLQSDDSNGSNDAVILICLGESPHRRGNPQAPNRRTHALQVVNYCKAASFRLSKGNRRTSYNVHATRW